jgi:hypothetical protein
LRCSQSLRLGETSMSGSGGMLNSSIRRWLDNVRGHHVGSADVMGQGVQPQPPDRLLPQQERSGPGGAELRRAAPADQAAPAAVGVWGAQPRRRRKRGYLRRTLAQRECPAKQGRSRRPAWSRRPRRPVREANRAPLPPTEVAALARRPPRPPQAGAGGQRP